MSAETLASVKRRTRSRFSDVAVVTGPLLPLAGRCSRMRRAGPLQRAVDRGDAGLEQGGGLLGRPAEHVAQDQRGALARRQELDRGEEGELDRLARDDHRVRLVAPSAATSSSSRSG